MIILHIDLFKNRLMLFKTMILKTDKSNINVNVSCQNLKNGFM